MYNLIDAKRSTRKLYTESLIGRGDITVEEAEHALRDYQGQLERVFTETRESTQESQPEVATTRPAFPASVDTAISEESVKRIVDSQVSLPEGFTVHPRLAPQLQRRAAMIDNATIDWAMGETLAFGSLLLEGRTIRLAGQDSRRGTFGQRHSVFVDRITGEEYTPLSHLSQDQGRFFVYDSLLSEYAEKFETLNKWNVVTIKRQAQRQGRKEFQGNYNQRQSGDSNTYQGRNMAEARKGREQEYDKAPTDIQVSAKPRYINSERLVLGNNGPPMNKKPSYGIKPREDQAEPPSRFPRTQVPYKKFMSSSQTLTVNGVQVHAFNQPVLFQENKVQSKEKENTGVADIEVPMNADAETKKDNKEPRQVEANTDMVGVDITSIQKSNSI